MLLALLLESPPGGILYDMEAGFLLKGADAASSKKEDVPAPPIGEGPSAAGPCCGRGGGTTNPPEEPPDGLGGMP